ncbi:unnamed protein product [Caenorhabditis angaria]|uniref:Uncharacterized protein n=1 Tax=Caenorhabditis angaria TaxID=860376 RepID=A0A9P1J1K7_9PELO|nr:unnamed protein product [Caenorhabditis angaria]
MPDKRLTRAERKRKAERQQKTEELNKRARPGYFLFTPPRGVIPRSDTPQTTSGNVMFNRFSSDGEQFDEVADPAPQQPQAGPPPPPAAADVQQPVVQDDVNQVVVAPVDAQVARPEDVVAPARDVVVQAVSEESSADESDNRAAQPVIQRRRRRRRRRGDGRRRGAFVYERPAVLMGDPHEGEVVIDLFLPPVEDDTQRESDSDAP